MDKIIAKMLDEAESALNRRIDELPLVLGIPYDKHLDVYCDKRHGTYKVIPFRKDTYIVTGALRLDQPDTPEALAISKAIAGLYDVTVVPDNYCYGEKRQVFCKAGVTAYGLLDAVKEIYRLEKEILDLQPKKDRKGDSVRLSASGAKAPAAAAAASE